MSTYPTYPADHARIKAATAKSEDLETAHAQTCELEPTHTAADCPDHEPPTITAAELRKPHRPSSLIDHPPTTTRKA